MFEKTEVILGQDARDGIIKGINILGDAVGSTLGPMGNNVIIQRNLGMFLTKDGVTVAKNINLEDSLENLGAQLVKQASAKTNTVAGDGTTTATVLAQSLTNRGAKLLKDNPTISAVEFKRGMEQAFKDVENYIKEKAVDIKGNYDSVQRVATISTNNDEELGKIIAEAFQAVGEHGIVSVDKSKLDTTVVEITEGMSFDKGYLSPFFVTDPRTMTCHLEDVLVLVHDGKINNMKHVVPVLEMAQSVGKPLLIIAEEVDPQTLSIMAYNVGRGNLQACAVKQPGFGKFAKDYLNDIAVLTGGQVISDAAGKPLTTCSLADLGSADKVTVSKLSTSIIGGQGDKKAIENRVKLLIEHEKQEEHFYNKEILQKRIAKLSSGVAVIKVGAVTDAELQERQYRVEDAINAVKAALKEGIVAGGGSTYFNFKDAGLKLADSSFSEEEESKRAGYETVMHCLSSPIEKLCTNSGITIEKVLPIKEGQGYNFKTNKVEDLLETGVIDPAVVAIEALRNAVSVAGMVLTTNCALTMIAPEVDAMDHGYDPSMINPG